MFKPYFGRTVRMVAIAAIALALGAGCGKTAPTPTPLPPTDAPAPTLRAEPTRLSSSQAQSEAAAPTDAPAPTDTPTPAPTNTPTPTPTPTPPSADELRVFTSDVPPANASLGDAWMRPADGALMVYVPGGDFLMGSSEAEIEAELAQCEENYSVCYPQFYTSESPQHPVTLDGFWMDRTEVTNAQYTAFLNEYGNMGENKATFVVFNGSYCRIRQVDGVYEVNDRSANHPVVMVTRHGAEAYCKSVGAQLPTEAQWEYAARGPEGNIYPWGNDAPTRELAQFGWGTTAPAGSHPDGASWCGVQDMAGNVWEWVADWHGRYPSGAQVNPTGPSSGGLAVSRGGGWHSSQREVRSAFRLYDTPPSGYNG